MKQSSIHRTAYGSHGSRLIADELGFIHLTVAAARAAGLSLRLARLHARHNRAIVRDILEKSAPRHALEQAQADADLAQAAHNHAAYMRAARRVDRALESLDKRAMRPHEKPGPAAVRVDYGWEPYAVTIQSRRGETVEAFEARVAAERVKCAQSSARALTMRIRGCANQAATAAGIDELAQLKSEALAAAELFRVAASVAPCGDLAELVADALARLETGAESRQ